jgi:predicted  nucleic acid-binding Zn-ribbon protein
MEMELQNTYDMDAARRAVDAVGKTETDAKSEVEAAVRARDEAKALNEQTRRMVESIINKQRSLERSQAKSASWTPTPSVTTVRPAFAAAATGSDVKSSTIRVAGLTLAPVTSELAEYLGAGSRDGFLVLESEGEWSAVHPGDVLLSVNGQCVRQSGRVATLDSEDAHDIVVLRKGQRMTVHLVGG